MANWDKSKFLLILIFSTGHLDYPKSGSNNAGNVELLVEERRLGDVNLDGVMTEPDLAALKNVLAGNSSVPFSLENGDLNRNKKVDLMDPAFLNLCLSGVPIPVYITPENGATVSGDVSLYAENIFTTGLSQLKLTTDGVVKANISADPTTPSPTWLRSTLKSTNLTNGRHVIGIIAINTAGKSYETTITINVNNPN